MLSAAPPPLPPGVQAVDLTGTGRSTASTLLASLGQRHQMRAAIMVVEQVVRNDEDTNVSMGETGTAGAWGCMLKWCWRFLAPMSG